VSSGESAGPAADALGGSVHELQPDTRDFTDRQPAVSLIRSALRGSRHHHGTATPLVAISGRGGVGKTALAIHVAHLVLAEYPDGQIELNLRGLDKFPALPYQLLGELLVELGLPSHAVPDGLDERARRFRSLVSGRRMLILLDNASNEAQVRPLIPGSPNCGVIVTSRNPLRALDSCEHIDLAELAEGAARELLDKIAGPDYIAADPKSSSIVLKIAAGLPLAIRIAGGKIARGTDTVENIATRMSDEKSKLDEFRLGDLEIRATFMSSYRLLSPVAARGFRFLSTLDVSDLSLPAVTSVLGWDDETSERIVTELLNAQLLDFVAIDACNQPRYRIHDLLRAFGRRLAEDDDAADVAVALQRLARAYGAWLAFAEEHVEPGDVHRMTSVASEADISPRVKSAIVRQPMAWFNSERTVAIQLVRQVYAMELHDAVWSIAQSLSPSAENRLAWPDWQDALVKAVTGRSRLGDLEGEAQALFLLGDSLIIQERHREASEPLTKSSSIFRNIGDVGWSALAELDLSYVLILEGDLEAAERGLNNCLDIFTASSDPQHNAEALCDLAIIRASQLRFAEAEEMCAAAVAVFRERGNKRWLVFGLVSLGKVYLENGDVPRALDCFAEALPILESDDRLWTAGCLNLIAHAFSDGGRRRFARRAWTHAAVVYRAHEKSAEEREVETLLRGRSSRWGPGWARR
jgi:tetratricopeptide (TPR) repeat protein